MGAAEKPSFLKIKIGVLAIPAHEIDRLQPLDVSVFKPMKTNANTAIKNKMKSEVASLTQIYKTGSIFSWHCIKSAHENAIFISNIISGFQRTSSDRET